MTQDITISGSSVRKLALTIAAIAVAGIVVVLIARQMSDSSSDPLTSNVSSSRYQAVVLDDGNIYFGKLSSIGDGFYKLKHATYLRQKPVDAADKNAKAVPQVVRASEQLYQPDDTMLINRDRIARVENLSTSSRVADAIDRLSK